MQLAPERVDLHSTKASAIFSAIVIVTLRLLVMGIAMLNKSCREENNTVEWIAGVEARKLILRTRLSLQASERGSLQPCPCVVETIPTSNLSSHEVSNNPSRKSARHSWKLVLLWRRVPVSRRRPQCIGNSASQSHTQLLSNQGIKMLDGLFMLVMLSVVMALV